MTNGNPHTGDTGRIRPPKTAPGTKKQKKQTGKRPR
jgi:hypothetical protein